MASGCQRVVVMGMISEKELYIYECENNSKERLCRSRGGESCALDGALIVLQPIADALHIIHSPINCCAISYDGRGAVSDRGVFNHMGFTTDMKELNIVYGSEERLKKYIIELDGKYNPKGIFVYLSCISGLIGEDIESVCKETSGIIGKLVVPVLSPGFVGPKNLGNRIAGEALLKYVIGTAEPAFTTDCDINLIGEYNIAGDIYEIEKILKDCGLRVLSRITGNSSFEEIRYAHRARLNVMICSRALINIALSLKKNYQIDFIEASFYGPAEIKRSLIEIALKLKNILILRKVEDYIKSLDERIEKGLKEYQVLKGKKALLYSGGIKGWSLISTLKDMGIKISAVITKKMSYDDEEKAKQLLDKDAELLEKSDASTVKKYFTEKRADILIAGGRNKYLAIKENIPFVDVNQERHKAYAGIDGFFNLCEDIKNAYLFYYPKLKKRLKSPAIIQKEFIENPIKLPQSFGAIIALQGFKNILPVIHSAQGCNFLSKVMLIKHFREPISVNTSNLFTEEIVMGGEEKLIESIEKSIKNKMPSLIAVLSASLSEIRGSNLDLVLKAYRADIPKAIIKVPDYEGGLEDGYAKAIIAVLEPLLNKNLSKQQKDRYLINVIGGSHLTPMDFNEIKEIFYSFGLEINLIPDLSALDGSAAFSGSVTGEGFDLKKINKIARAGFSIVFGKSLESVAMFIKEKTGTDYKVFETSLGLKATDSLIKFLKNLGAVAITKRTFIKRERKILEDLIKDAQFYLFGKRVSVALESDCSVNICSFLTELGMKVTRAVIPDKSPTANSIRCQNIIVGGLEELDSMADLWIASSRARHSAERQRIPLIYFGYPSYSDFGTNLRQTIGYKAAIRFLTDLVNTVKGEII